MSSTHNEIAGTAPPLAAPVLTRKVSVAITSSVPVSPAGLLEYWLFRVAASFNVVPSTLLERSYTLEVTDWKLTTDVAIGI